MQKTLDQISNVCVQLQVISGAATGICYGTYLGLRLVATQLTVRPPPPPAPLSLESPHVALSRRSKCDLRCAGSRELYETSAAHNTADACLRCRGVRV